jgi:hypothetical protein
MPRLNASRLRADVYRVLDEVIETGRPIEVERRGHVIKLVLVPATKKLDALVERPGFIRGEPRDLAEVGWADSWKP